MIIEIAAYSIPENKSSFSAVCLIEDGDENERWEMVKFERDGKELKVVSAPSDILLDNIDIRIIDENEEAIFLDDNFPFFGLESDG